jgi:hypothetical protein
MHACPCSQWVGLPGRCVSLFMESDYSEEVPAAHVYVVNGLVDAGGVLKMHIRMLLKLGGRSTLHVPLSQRVPSKTMAGAERLVFIAIYGCVQLKKS